MKEEEKTPRIVQNLDSEKTSMYRALILARITQVITSHPKSAESAAGALAALITAAYWLAKAMWGPAEAARAIKSAVDLEVAADKAKEQAN